MSFRLAIVLSLVLHLAAYVLAELAGLAALPAPPARPVIEAMLIVPDLPPPQEAPPPRPAPPSQALKSAPPSLPPAPPPAPRAASAPQAPGASQAQLVPKVAEAKANFYPAEAVLRGIEGEALVRLTLDPSGRVVSARLERGSGHAILDDAALRAALTLGSLPGGSGEAVLPVRFRLK